MAEEECLRWRDQLDALNRIARDEVARRDLLWLRAMAKDDEEEAASLERIDPELRSRMWGVLDEVEGVRLTGRDRREYFAQEWHIYFDRYARAVCTRRCVCARCRERKWLGW